MYVSTTVDLSLRTSLTGRCQDVGPVLGGGSHLLHGRAGCGRLQRLGPAGHRLQRAADAGAGLHRRHGPGLQRLRGASDVMLPGALWRHETTSRLRCHRHDAGQRRYGWCRAL